MNSTCHAASRAASRNKNDVHWNIAFTRLTVTPPLVTSTRMSDPIETLSFEDALKELEAIVSRLETGDAALDESIALYTRGEALRAQCEKRLKDAQARIEKITLGADGSPNGTAPFDDN
jgi:exodeoxyribonuclease VII small subunit